MMYLYYSCKIFCTAIFMFSLFKLDELVCPHSKSQTTPYGLYSIIFFAFSIINCIPLPDIWMLLGIFMLAVSFSFVHQNLSRRQYGVLLSL